ncbi:MAG TPA: M28 family peptidase [Bryobacteraceae bacterium]|nr:M28 family peptidase [Bryobacteraceae bacterium]
MNYRILTALIAAACAFAQAPRAPQEAMKPLHPLDESYLVWPVSPENKAYAAIDGKHLKEYVEEQAAISRAYRDKGHQFWGRIIGTEADQQNAEWMMGIMRKAGLTDVHQQMFDLPPQWMPQSWSVTASSDGQTIDLATAQPTHRAPGTDAAGLDLEAVDVGMATPGDLANRDLRGKAVFFYSNDFFSRHATANNGAWKRLEDLGAAAIFITLNIPGNARTQFYPVNTKVPTFSLGYQDGLAVHEMIGKARGAAAPHVRIKMDVQMVPGEKTSTVWSTLPGTTDETVIITAHRDGWFEGANDNGTGVATMLGLAEYFAKIPKEQRRRTIIFLGTSGHHDGTAESGTWLSQHKEVFAKNALLINCEHTAVNDLIIGNGVVTKSNWAAPLNWYIGGSKRLEDIAVKAYAAFGVPTDEIPARTPAGEIGRIYQNSPAIQLIGTGLFWHSERETADVIPAPALANVTRAYAKIIADIDNVPLKDLQRAN